MRGGIFSGFVPVPRTTDISTKRPDGFVQAASRKVPRSIADLNAPVQPATSIPVALANNPAAWLFDVDPFWR
jgi:hypothetical protein